MSVSAILNAQGKVPAQYIDFNAPPFTGYITNPLTSDLQCYNPATATNHAIIEASYVSAGEVKTDTIKLLPGSVAPYITVDENIRVNGGMELISDAAKVEFKNAAGVLKGSMGYNVGTDFMDLTGAAGFEINTTAGPINMTANGDKINITTNGNNVEIFGNTTGGFFADINIGTSDGVIQLGAGGIVEFISPTEVITKSLAVIETATPTLRFQTTGVGPTSVDVVYNPTGSQFSESALTTSAHEIGVYTGVVGENIAMGVNQALQTSYITGQGLPLFLGENGSSSYSGLYLGNGNNPTDFLILDRKDNTNVSNSACSIGLTGAGIINITSQLAGGDIGIATNAVANIGINSGNNILIQAAEDIDITTLTASTANISLNSAHNIKLDCVNNLDLISANGITLTTTNSTSVGITTDADLILTGAGIEFNTAGADSGQFLRIKLNGTFYKILLKND